MPTPQRRQPVALVLLSVFVVADANEGRFEQMNDGRHDFQLGQSAQRHMLGHGRADGGQRFGERPEMLVFRLLSPLAVGRMVAILLAAPGVSTRRLNMSVRRRTNPHILPGRRYDK